MSTQPVEKTEPVVADDAVDVPTSASNGVGASPGMADPSPYGTVQGILEADDLGEVVVDVEEWGPDFKVLIRGIGRAEFRAVQKNSTPEGAEEVDSDLADAWLMHLCMVRPSLTLKDATKIVAEKSIPSTQRVTEAIMEASGLGDGFR